jgi:hypothetical protein
MATGTELASSVAAPAAGVKGFILAHPVGVAIIGGALVAVGTYYLMKKFLDKKEEPVPAES